MKYQWWCCQKCGENIGVLGRFMFPWFHKCEPQKDRCKGCPEYGLDRDCSGKCP